MKYEEHLLQVTAQVGRSEEQWMVDIYKKKLLTQKQNYDQEVNSLKKKLELMEREMQVIRFGRTPRTYNN